MRGLNRCRGRRREVDPPRERERRRARGIPEIGITGIGGILG